MKYHGRIKEAKTLEWLKLIEHKPLCYCELGECLLFGEVGWISEMDIEILGFEILLFSLCMILTILCIAGGVCVLKISIDFIKNKLD